MRINEKETNKVSKKEVLKSNNNDSLEKNTNRSIIGPLAVICVFFVIASLIGYALYIDHTKQQLY